MVTATKAITNVRWYLEKDKRYFLREFDIVEGLKRDVEAASNLNKSAKYKNKAGVLGVVESDIKNLERQERWQQFRTRYPKLKEAMNELLALPVLTSEQKKRVGELLQIVSVWEGNLLKDTVETLDPMIRNKKPDEVNWEGVQTITSKLEQDLRALVAVDGQLKTALGLK